MEFAGSTMAKPFPVRTINSPTAHPVSRRGANAHAAVQTQSTSDPDQAVGRVERVTSERFAKQPDSLATRRAQAGLRFMM